MERLSGGEELLDGRLDDPAALVGNLRDLRRINRLLGGTRLSRTAIERLVPGWTDLDLLDVGTGGADIPLALLADARRAGRRLRVTALDSRPEVLAAAALARPGLPSAESLILVVGDGRSIDAPDGSCDVAHCSLVVHHLEPADAVGLLREMTRVARRGIVVNDLVRARRHWVGARILTGLLTRNRYTRHDGPLSVRRAYTRPELRGLFRDAGLRVIAEVGGPAGHRVALAAVRATADGGGA
jgi:ubiquinone/menaquinone biosynthesis C-methylase UbiE